MLIESVIIKKSSPNDWYSKCIGRTVKVIPIDDESFMPWTHIEEKDIVEIRGIKVKKIYLVIDDDDIFKFSNGTPKIKTEDCVLLDEHRDTIIDKILG